MRRRLFSQKTARNAAAFASFAVLVSAGCDGDKYRYKPNPNATANPGDNPTLSLPAPSKKEVKKEPAERRPRARSRRKSSKEKGCPPEMAQVNNFCIDRWEIHLVNDQGEVYPKEKIPPQSMNGWKAASAEGVYPQGYMSHHVARKACENAGKRMCTLKQWTTACRGKSDYKFPYGNEYQEGKCNVGQRWTLQDGIVVLPARPHILDIMDPPPENATEAAYKAHHAARQGNLFNDPRAALTPGYLAKTGEYKQCVSGGWDKPVYDMDGNLSEWVSATRRTKRGLMGVFMADGHSGTAQLGCEREVAAHPREYHDYSMGTRCCKRPK